MSGLALLLGGAALAAQAGLDSPAQQTPPTLPPPPLVTPVASDVPGATVDVMAGGATDLAINEKKSEMVLSYAWGSRTHWVVSGSPIASVVHNAFTAELTLPLGGGSNLLSRESFDGLVDGPSLSLAWTSFGTQSGDPWDPTENRALPGLVNRAVARCTADVQAGLVEGLTQEQCTRGREEPNNAFLRRFSGLSIADLNRALLSPVSGYGIEASIGLNRFNYRTPVTLAENADTLRQFSIKVYGVLFPDDGVSMLTGSARYENSYEAQDDQILCRAVIANANDDCVSAPPGPPNRVEKLQLELQYRRSFEPIPGLGRFAIAPRIAIDVLNDDYEAELPIYLTPIGTDRILPGVAISYDSRHDEVTVGLFLRRRFSF